MDHYICMQTQKEQHLRFLHHTIPIYTTFTLYTESLRTLREYSLLPWCHASYSSLLLITHSTFFLQSSKFKPLVFLYPSPFFGLIVSTFLPHSHCTQSCTNPKSTVIFICSLFPTVKELTR